jgi:glycosyltransferase involved in cell wall biosynthesis
MPEKMKIAIVTTYWKNSSGGGIKIYLQSLVETLKGRGLNVRVIFREGEDLSNYRIYEESKLPFPMKIISAYRNLEKIRPDVIHSHGGLYYYLIAGNLYRMLNGGKLVYTFHTEPEKGDRLPILKRIMLQFLLNRCDSVTFVSKMLQNRVREIWGFKFRNSKITYAGVNLREVSPDAVLDFRRRFGIRNDSPILLALGFTVLSYKADGLKLLIKSLKNVKEKYPNITLVATRDGRYVDELKQISMAEGLEKNVIFTGDIDDQYVALAACDIYAHISLGEGLPLSLLEAMSMGKPIIATPVGGIPEAIEDGQDGLLVEPNPDKIAEKILCLLKNKPIAEMLGMNAKAVAKERFTWENAADRFIDLYKDARDASAYSETKGIR